MASETFADELRAAVAGDKFTLYTELMLQAAELLDHKDEQINTRPAPAATDAGQETVHTQVRFGPNDVWRNEVFVGERSRITERRELVTRSQAEAIIADWKKRAEYAERELAKSILKVASIEADNAAKDARVTELEDMLLKRQKRYERRVVALEAKLAAAEKLLHGTVAAWESLPGGRNYSTGDVQDWILGPMQKAINRIRAVLGGKPS